MVCSVVDSSTVRPDDDADYINTQSYSIDYVKVYQKDSYNEDVEKPVNEVIIRDPDANGNYVLFGDLEGPDTLCLCNLDTHKYIKFTIPKELRSDIEMYLSAVKSKMLITDGKDAYLVQCP